MKKIKELGTEVEDVVMKIVSNLNKEDFINFLVNQLHSDLDFTWYYSNTYDGKMELLDDCYNKRDILDFVKDRSNKSDDLLFTEGYHICSIPIDMNNIDKEVMESVTIAVRNLTLKEFGRYVENTDITSKSILNNLIHITEVLERLATLNYITNELNESEDFTEISTLVNHNITKLNERLKSEAKLALQEITKEDKE